MVGILLMVIGWTRKYRDLPGNRWFMLANVAMLYWFIATAIEMSVPDAFCKVTWAKLTWPGILLMPTAWALFLYEYALARKVRFSVRVVAVWVMPALFSLAAITNDLHHLFYTEATRLVESPQRTYVEYAHGPIFFAAIVYLYFFIAGSTVIAGLAAFRAAPTVRSFFTKLLAITFLPVIANVAYVFFGVTLFNTDPTPFLFSVSLVAIVWLIADSRWIDVNAMARELLFYNSHDVYLVADLNGRLYGCNPEAQAVFGRLLPGDSLRGVPHIGPLIERLDELMNAEEPTVLTRDGRSFVLRIFPLSLEPVQTKLGWVLALVDVTAQQQAAETMRDAARRAEAADQAKSQFLSTVSHELRTPLTVIKGSLELVNNKTHSLPQDKTAKLLEMAQDNANSLAALVDDLLELQRMENAQFSMTVEPIELGHLARDTLASLGSYQSQKDVELKLEAPEAALVVEGDRQRLRQVLANMLSNAIKFSHPSSTVTLRLEAEGALARISVIDTGMGIPDDAKEKVFGRFTQIDSSDSRNLGGSGLGMHITRQILKQHGATIDYVSKLGSGTTFIVEIPLLMPETAASPPSQPAEPLAGNAETAPDPEAARRKA